MLVRSLNICRAGVDNPTVWYQPANLGLTSTSIPKKSYKATIFYIQLCFCYIYKQFYSTRGWRGFSRWLRCVSSIITRLSSGNQTHDSIRCYYSYGSIMNFPSSLGVLLWEPRPNIDTLLCSIGLECVQRKTEQAPPPYYVYYSVECRSPCYYYFIYYQYYDWFYR